jgi:chorismate mutase/prephenate dehydratase
MGADFRVWARRDAGPPPRKPDEQNCAARESRWSEGWIGMELDELRAEMDEIDWELVQLLNRRAKLSLRIGETKRQHAPPGTPVPVYQPQREAQVLDQVSQANQGPLPDAALRAIYREILSSSRALQQPVRVAYLGPVGTFSYEAARLHFGSSTELVACRTIADVFLDTQKGTANFGVVPIENSTEGAVTPTHDRFLESDLQICAQIELPVTHNLLARGRLDQITTVYSHPQPLAQCRRWLADNLPRATQVETPSTAAAAALVRDESIAAIATESAALLNNVPILARHIEDVATNVTRFFVIGRERAGRTGHDRTALTFSVQNRAGALHEALKAIADNGVNLTRIESRPSRRRLWEYVFFVELDGHPDDPEVARSLGALDQCSAYVHILGSWPR